MMLNIVKGKKENKDIIKNITGEDTYLININNHKDAMSADTQIMLTLYPLKIQIKKHKVIISNGHPKD